MGKIKLNQNGKTYETKKISIQLEKKFDQELYFLFGEKNDILKKNQEERKNVIMKNLKTKNTILMNLWLEDNYGCKDFLGQFEIFLIDIFEKGKNQERKYKRDENDFFYYVTRVLVDKSQFDSSYTKQENFILDYEAWFYPSSFTNAVEITKDELKKMNKSNPINETVEKFIK
jgi:hypothetical protein